MAAESIISRLSTRLSGATSNNRDMPDMGTRSMGGSFRNNHPYVSGYFHVIFDLPNAIFSGNEDVAVKWLHSSCESFSPPSETINYTELTGLGQVKSRFYTSRSVTNDITFAFREYQNLPVLNILSLWTGFIDPFTGVSSFKGNSFIPSSYKGVAYVLQTKPVGAFPSAHLTEEDIEEAWIFDGVWPTALPTDTLSSDLSSSDAIQYSVNFSYDGYPIKSSEGAISTCLEAYTSLGHSSISDTLDNFLTRGARTISGEPSIGG